MDHHPSTVNQEAEYCNCSHSYGRRTATVTSHIETLTIKIKTISKLTIGAAYSLLLQVKINFSDLHAAVLPQGSRLYIIGGDFNAKLTLWNKNQNKQKRFHPQKSFRVTQLPNHPQLYLHP